MKKGKELNKKKNEWKRKEKHLSIKKRKIMCI